MDQGMDESIPLLHAYLPDIQNTICEEFQNAECSVEVSPELTEPPFNFAFHALGKKIHLLPSGSMIPKDFHQISVISEGMVVTDGLASEYLHLVLEGGDDWRTPLQKVFNKKLGINWCFLVMELQSDTIHFYTLHAQTKPIKNYAECTTLWLSELEQISTSQALSKPKTNKKIVKKSMVEKNAIDTEVNGKISATKTIKNGNGQKIVRKKLAAAILAISPTTIPVTDDTTKTGNDSSVNSKKTVTSKARNSLTNNMNGENYINGDGSADSGISLVDSDTEKSSKCTKGTALAEHERIIPSMVKQTESMNGAEFAIPIRTSKTNLETTNNDDMDNYDNATISIISAIGNIPIYHSDLPPSFTMRRNNIKYEMNKKVGRIVEEEEKEKSEDLDRCDGVELTNDHSVPDRYINGRDPLIPVRRSTPTYINSKISRSFLSNGSDSLQRISSRDDISIIRRFADQEIPPVQVLQLVLKNFSYKELGELRQVHPHWDELCGQALNSGYHELIKKADKILTDCQRRVHSEPDLHDVLSILTNVQVHILNPVDILRPAMDEGVCCFPYGELLDQTFHIVKKAKEVMEGKRDIIINWKPVAELARRAQLHYKFNLAALMEEKLGEVIRLKALQSIQRIDSFMIDSTVNKLEKATNMARDELEWEIEQLRHQNAQLKKDNRELKKDCMRLEARVEIIENKFKTMARLLH
ncbi:unnamed protein product [Cercopithifilaria johnstoni]|uniref:Uncharacterized protein n=1 Tax=Cercopithifilaria johnstoni TaxID=2874296 RepID=A0A8J2MC89_9BILA|nr:unnamed protein product [Cercopithifilaria johnstoni]